MSGLYIYVRSILPYPIIMHLSMLSPTSPLPGIGADMYNLLFKGHTPGAIIFYNAPQSLDALNTLGGQCGDLYIYNAICNYH